MTAANAADWPEWSTSDLIERVNEGQLMEDSACPTCLCPAAFHQKIIDTATLDFGTETTRVRLYCPRDVFDTNGARIEKVVSGYWERMGTATRLSPYGQTVNTYLLQANALRRLDDVDAQAKALLSIANADRRKKFQEVIQEKQRAREERIKQTTGVARQQLENKPGTVADVLRQLYGQDIAERLKTFTSEQEAAEEELRELQARRELFQTQLEQLEAKPDRRQSRARAPRTLLLEEKPKEKKPNAPRIVATAGKRRYDFEE
jgi:hypothetical protein